MSGGLDDTSESKSRFSDVESGPTRRLPPIQGFEKEPLVSLEKAVAPLLSLVPQVEQMVWTVKGSCTQPNDGLSVDQSASIMLYTLEWAPSETSFYFILNTVLRSADREKVTTMVFISSAFYICSIKTSIKFTAGYLSWS